MGSTLESMRSAQEREMCFFYLVNWYSNKWNTIDCQQGSNTRIGSEVAWLVGAVERTTPTRSGRIDRATTRIAQVWAAVVYKGKY